MAEDGILLGMQDWIDQTDRFLDYNRRNILTTKGKVSHDRAMDIANEVYNKFRIKQDGKYISEFDKEMSKYLKGE